MNIIGIKAISKTDLLGVFSAGLCTVHCLAAPLLLALFSTTGWFHIATYFFLAISIYAAYTSTRNTQSKLSKSLIFSGLALLFVAIIFEDYVHWFHELSYVASAGLILGHILNMRYATCKVQA